VALSEDLAVMVKENQLVSGQLSQSAQQVDDSRDELHKLSSNAGVLKQTLKARELELEDMRAAYEDLAVEDRQHQSHIGQLKRQLGGHSVELDAAKQEVMHLQEAQHSAQLQMQQYVVDIQALERNSDVLARELQTAKGESEDLARDRNRVLEQMQAAQVLLRSAAALHGHLWKLAEYAGHLLAKHGLKSAVVCSCRASGMRLSAAEMRYNARSPAWTASFTLRTLDSTRHTLR
jgi:chromosome segregation ATPase